MPQTRTASKLQAQMSRSWEIRAHYTPLYAIDASRNDWDFESFYERGHRLAAAILDPALERLGFDPAGKRVLEIGCGIGRLFPSLLERFGEVWGLDISSTMIELGKSHCDVAATWYLGDGSTLERIESDSVDFVISFEVFQHIPDESVIACYLGEVARVLRPGGAFQIQMRRGSDSGQQAIVRAAPRPVRLLLASGLRRTGLLPVGGDIDTWLGCVLPIDRGLAMAREAGLSGVEVLPDHLHPSGMGYWLVGYGEGVGLTGQ